MENNKITMIMPTFNHPTYIEYFIKNAIIPYKGKIFKFEIHDSSVNNDTKEIIEKFNGNYSFKIKYFRYDSSMNGDLKTYKALSQCESQHIYLMGDGVCPDFNKLEEYLLKNNYDKYDLLGIFVPEWIKRFKKDGFEFDKIYDKYPIDEFFGKFFHEFTYYGGSIISKNVWNYVVDNSIYEKFEFNDRYSFAYDSSVFSSLTLNSNFKYGISFISFYRGNPMKKSNGWCHGDTLYEIGLLEFESDVNNLPTIFNDYKEAIIKKNRKTFFDLRLAIRYRIDNSLNFKLIKKYKKNLKHVKSNYFMLLFVCFIPKFVLKFLRSIKRTLKRSI